MYKGNVYNLSVWKDESYITKIGITHNCRCDVIQTAEDASDNIPDIDPNIKPEFEMNIGKSGQVFKEDGDKHGFFALAEKGKDWKKRFELSKLEGGYNKLLTPKGNTIKESIYADQRKDELQPNRDMAIWATDFKGYDVKILPKLDGMVLRNIKNPEFLINGKYLADRKTPTTLNYTKTLSKANKQKCNIVFIDLLLNGDDVGNAYNTITSLLSKQKNKAYPHIKEVYIISKDKKKHKHIIRNKRAD